MIQKYLACAIVISLFGIAHPGHGQSMERMAVEPWKGTDFVATYDHPIFESTGHLKGSNVDATMSFWDSFGRVRFDKQNPESPFMAYRVFTSNLDTDSRTVHPTMDEFDLAAGFKVGEFGGWKIDTLLGLGYSGTHPFLNEKGIFGIGDVTATKALTDQTSLLLAVDYAGNNGLLPDVPLPGFAVIHRAGNCNFMLGFPVNKVEWQPCDQITVSADYTVPFTADLDVEYIPFEHVGFYANAGNFFQGFVIAKRDTVDRQFFQSRHAEIGMRFIFDPLLDASVGIGYAFDQSFSDGYDVRNLRPVAQLSNEPYLAIVLHGRF